MANLNSFLSPYEILPVAPENKYLRKNSYFILKLYVITKIYLYNFDPLKPHFYWVKLGITGVNIFFSYFC